MEVGRRRGGFVGALLDTRFEYYATTRLARGVYLAALALVSSQCFFWFMIGWWLAAGRFWPFVGWVMIASTPVVWIGELAAVRVGLEYVIVVFRMGEDLRESRDGRNARKVGDEAGPSELWTVEDLAGFLRKPTSWVYENYRELYPFYRVGQAVRFDPGEIRRTLREQFHQETAHA